MIAHTLILDWAVVWGGYAADPWRAARSFGLMSVVAAAVFYFAAVMPAFDFYYTAALDAAQFAQTATLPWPSRETQAALAGLRATNRPSALVWDGGTAGVTGSCSTVRGVTMRSLDGSSTAGLGLTYYTPALMRGRSSLAGDGSRALAILDTTLARRVGAHVGGTVSIRDEAQRAGARMVARVRVVGLVLPTNETSGVLLLGTPRLPSAASRQSVQVFWARPGPEGLMRGAGLPAEVTVMDPQQALSRGRTRLEQLISRNTRFVLIWASLAVYAGYQLWDAAQRTRDRRRRFAVLLSMGAEERRLAGVLWREQALVGAATAVSGAAAGAFVLVQTSGLYVPPDSIAAVVAYAFVVNLGVATVGRVLLRRQLRTLPVAALLAES